MNILITGSTGYIGSTFLEYAQKSGHKLLIASRNKGNNPYSWIYFDLSKTNTPLEINEKVDCIIHFAANTTRSASPTPSEEIASANALIATSKKLNANFLFISSQTAHQHSKTIYGQIKWKVEQIVLENGGAIARPGLVYGGKPTGVFGAILNLLKKSPIFPSLWPEPLIQPIHIEDLMYCLIKIIKQPQESFSDIYLLGEPTPTSFNVFTKMIAQIYIKKKIFFIATPTLPINFLFRFLCFIRLPVPTKIDQFNSLINLPIMGTIDSLRKLKVKLRSINSRETSLVNCRRRLLICEGATIYSRLSSEKISPDLLKRYVRFVEKIHSGRPLNIHFFHLKVAHLLVLWPMKKIIGQSLTASLLERIDAATVLLETTPKGYELFIPLNIKSSPLKVIFRIIQIIFNELYSRAAGVLLFPIHYIYSVIKKLS